MGEYLNSLIHGWCKTLTALGIALVPMFFALDYFLVAPELLPRFAMIRLGTVAFLVGYFFLLRATQAGRWPHIHGYLLSALVGSMIAILTTLMGGFTSSYYVGMNLVMTGVAILLPWGTFHSTMVCLVMIALYFGINLAVPQTEPINYVDVINNGFFLFSTAIIAVSIAHVKQRLIEKEFTTRMSLWAEMEVAKKIQISLLPKIQAVRGYQVAAVMLPAAEVGGDYYDIIETAAGETWLSIGDVSGHGVESGLIMMMTQTTISATVTRQSGLEPSSVLQVVNSVIKDNIARLGVNRYMTLTVLRLEPDRIVFSGKHQDILIHRHGATGVENIPTQGTWIGVVDDLSSIAKDSVEPIAVGDLIVLFTDGATEATNSTGQMFGETTLRDAVARYAHYDPAEVVARIVADLQNYMTEQNDDVTIIVLRRDDNARANYPST